MFPFVRYRGGAGSEFPRQSGRDESDHDLYYGSDSDIRIFQIQGDRRDGLRSLGAAV
jgi:hypothetical protein